MNSSGNAESERGSEYEENLELLRQIDFFSGFPLESLKVFAYLGARQRFRAGEILFEQGEEDATAFSVISGRLRLERESGGVVWTIRRFEAGAFIGGLSLLGPCRRLYTLRAEETTVCLALEREKFTRTLEQFPAQMPRLFQTVVNAIVGWEENFLEEMSEDCGRCIPRLGVSLL